MGKVKYICPRCGAMHTRLPREVVYCRYCKTQLIETKVTCEEYAVAIHNKTDDKLDAELFNEYVRNNPLYDPDEETRTYLKRQADKAEIERKYSSNNTSKPKCPQCGSENIRPISTTSRLLSVGVFGLASGKIGKNYECLNCKHKW